MNIKKLNLPIEYKVDNYCIEKMKEALCNYIIPKSELYLKDGINIYLRFPLKITYKHKWYWCGIVEQNNQYYWYLRPYKKSYLLIHFDNDISFNKVIEAIKEH